MVPLNFAREIETSCFVSYQQMFHPEEKQKITLKPNLKGFLTIQKKILKKVITLH